MGYQIVKQPDGLLAVFSSYTDTIVFWDAGEEEIVDWFVELETARVRDRVRPLVRHVAAGEPRRAYFQFAMSWEDALAKDRKHGGEVWKEPQWRTRSPTLNPPEESRDG